MEVEFSYFALCSMLCREGLRSTLVCLRGSLGGGRTEVTVKIVNTKVARWARIRQTLPLCSKDGIAVWAVGPASAGDMPPARATVHARQLRRDGGSRPVTSRPP